MGQQREGFLVECACPSSDTYTCRIHGNRILGLRWDFQLGSCIWRTQRCNFCSSQTSKAVESDICTAESCWRQLLRPGRSWWALLQICGSLRFSVESKKKKIKIFLDWFKISQWRLWNIIYTDISDGNYGFCRLNYEGHKKVWRWQLCK